MSVERLLEARRAANLAAFATPGKTVTCGSRGIPDGRLSV